MTQSINISRKKNYTNYEKNKYSISSMYLPYYDFT